MAQRTAELGPATAMVGMFAALGEAGRYAGLGVWLSGRRVGRGARVFGTEAARRTGRAALALGGRQPKPQQRSRRGLVAAAMGATTAGAAAGAAAALAARQAVDMFRNRSGREPEAAAPEEVRPPRS